MAIHRSPALSAVDRAVLHAVAYADIFDYPLTAREVHRYLIGVAASPAVVGATLRRLVPSHLSIRDGYAMLPGREPLVDTRRRRAAAAAQLWPIAVRYGRRLGELPFVRMVAVTGSLALDNVEADDDVDYLVVTTPGRVWVGRGFTSLARRRAGRRGVRLCPNYVLSEDALCLDDRNLFTAHELVQMVPIIGPAVHRRMLRLNEWTRRYLPNARPAPSVEETNGANRGVAVRLAEGVLRTPIGAWVDRLERARLIRKTRRRALDLAEVRYSPDCCKDHVDAQGTRILAAFDARVNGTGTDR